MKIRDIMDWAKEGRKHGIPWCCGIRFGMGVEFNILYLIDAKLKGTPFEGLPRRVQSTLNPRHTHAILTGKGYVPCEGHYLWWLATGKMPAIKQTRSRHGRR